MSEFNGGTPMEWRARLAKVEAERDVQDEARRMAVSRYETAEARLAAVEAERDTWRTGYHNAEAATRRTVARLAAALTAADGMCANCHHGDLAWAVLRGEGGSAT